MTSPKVKIRRVLQAAEAYHNVAARLERGEPDRAGLLDEEMRREIEETVDIREERLAGSRALAQLNDLARMYGEHWQLACGSEPHRRREEGACRAVVDGRDLEAAAEELRQRAQRMVAAVAAQQRAADEEAA